MGRFRKKLKTENDTASSSNMQQKTLFNHGFAKKREEIQTDIPNESVKIVEDTDNMIEKSENSCRPSTSKTVVHHSQVSEETVNRWLKKYSFLVRKTIDGADVFYCSLCQDYKKSNKLTAGQKSNFQENTWTRHQETADHIDAMREKSGKMAFKKAKQHAFEQEINLLKDKEKGVVALLKVMKFVIDYNLPLTTFASLVQLCRELKCPDLDYLTGKIVMSLYYLLYIILFSLACNILMYIIKN
jgi:hypothetical protein